MEVFTLKEWEENFDELFSRVENGETIGVVREDGKAAVFIPSDEAEFLRIHTTGNNDAD
tara:strand:+ start:382 stop:558 length:177 start_codon:yes stop_codon:yes gene_type:complete